MGRITDALEPVVGQRWALSFDVAGVPKGKGSFRHVGGGKLKNDSAGTGPWQEGIAWAAAASRGALWKRLGSAMAPGLPWSGPISLELEFLLPGEPSVSAIYPTTKSDVDKLARTVLDALTGVLYVDDGQVVRLEASKVWAGARSPGVSVIVRGF